MHLFCRAMALATLPFPLWKRWLVDFPWYRPRGIGGTPDMIRHLEDGWLVPQRDVGELVKAIGALATSVELRRRLGRGS